MRFSTCSTDISLSIKESTFSSRWATFITSSTACRSAIFTARCEATVSASLAGSSIWETAATISGEIFLLSFT
jgi:hypothetical protein